MDFKKLLRALLFPHIAIMIILIPIAFAFLISSMVFLGTESPVSIISYVLAAYTLTVWCFKIPNIIAFFRDFKNKNKYVRLWLENPKLRVNVSLYTSLSLNVIYALLQLLLGLYHASFWFYSMAAYYISLAAMRHFVLRYTTSHKAGENIKVELAIYRICGWIFLFMNLALTLMVFFMVYFGRTFKHHEVTAIAMAAYTFTAFTLAIVSNVKFRKYKSPAYSVSKIISLASACVSMLTLETTLLTAFGGEEMTEQTRKIFLGATGGAISVFIIVMAIYMIVNSTAKIKELKDVKE